MILIVKTMTGAHLRVKLRFVGKEFSKSMKNVTMEILLMTMDVPQFAEWKFAETQSCKLLKSVMIRIFWTMTDAHQRVKLKVVGILSNNSTKNVMIQTL